MRLGAVIYSPQITIIWGIIADFFKENNFDLEPVFLKIIKCKLMR